MKVPLPAVELPKKLQRPAEIGRGPVARPLLVNTVDDPALAVPKKRICPRLVASALLTKFCVFLELFTIPAPNISKFKPGLLDIVKALALELKEIRSSVVPCEIEAALTLLELKLATSSDPSGTVVGFQFVAVFQSPEVGFDRHVALPANVFGETPKQANAKTANAR